MGLVQVDVDFFFQMTIPMTAIKATMIMAAIAQMGKLELSPPSLTRIILNEVSPTNVCPLRYRRSEAAPRLSPLIRRNDDV